MMKMIKLLKEKIIKMLDIKDIYSFIIFDNE